MAQFYTLEEAARVLGMGPEDLKAKAQHREVRAFMDSGSWQFRVADIDELARRRGLGSDPELSLSDLDLAVPDGSGSGDDLDLSEFQIGTAPADLGNRTVDFSAGQSGSDDDHDLQFDDLSLPPGPLSNSSSTIIGMKSGGKQPSDSDVRLVPDQPHKDASDSDVRMMSPTTPVKPSDSDVTLITEDVSLHGFNAVSGSSDAVISSVKGHFGSSDEMDSLPDESSSDFELMPSTDITAALQPESGSDFELTALDASDEFEATPMAGPNDSDVTAAQPGMSGLNLARPSDSGINLQAVGGFDMSQADSIELAPIDDDDEPARPAPKPKPKPAVPSTTVQPADPGATALGAVDKDIFEDTDFSLEVDDIDGDREDRTVQLEQGSDFDLEDSDSASEIFALDEDDVDLNAATAMAPAVLDEGDSEFDDDTPSGEIGSAWDDDASAGAVASPSEISAGPRIVAAGPQAEWGGIWVGLLAATSALLLVSTFISLDLIQNLYEFRGGGPASGLIKSISGLFG